MKARSIVIVLWAFSGLLIAYVLFRLWFYDSYEPLSSVSDSLKTQVVLDMRIVNKMNKYGIRQEQRNSTSVISRFGFTWTCSRMNPVILDVDSEHVLVVTDNDWWDSGLRAALPDYTDIHLLRVSDLQELRMIRLPGLVHAALLTGNRAVLRFTNGTYGRISLD